MSLLPLFRMVLAVLNFPLAMYILALSSSFSADRYFLASAGGIGPLSAARAAVASCAPAVLAAAGRPAVSPAVSLPTSPVTAWSNRPAGPVSHLAPFVLAASSGTGAAAPARWPGWPGPRAPSEMPMAAARTSAGSSAVSALCLRTQVTAGDGSPWPEGIFHGGVIACPSGRGPGRRGP